MKKGQGSLEYLLILAAILAIAVVVIVVANSMISSPSKTATLNQDKYDCVTKNIELVNYVEVGKIAAGQVKYNGMVCTTPLAAGTSSNCNIHTVAGAVAPFTVNYTFSGCSFNVQS